MRTSLPAQSCALVSAADVTRYLPGARGTPVSISAGSTVRTGICKWSSTADGEDRTLIARADVYRSASAVEQAQRAYRATLSAFGCHCPGVTVRTKPVTGLGDQAFQAFVVAGPTANFGRAVVASLPGASLLVESSNAVIDVNLDTTATATGISLTSSPTTAQSAGMIAMARDVLANLDRPASAVAPPPASLTAEPNYAGRPDSCRLISPVTLAKYVPGSTFTPLTPLAGVKPVPSSASVCGWTAGDFSAQLTVSTYAGAVAAGQQFQQESRIFSASNGYLVVTGMRWLNDLGAAALAFRPPRRRGRSGRGRVGGKCRTRRLLPGHCSRRHVSARNSEDARGGDRDGQERTGRPGQSGCLRLFPRTELCQPAGCARLV